MHNAGLLSLSSAREYVDAFLHKTTNSFDRASGLEIVPMKGLAYDSYAGLEAAAVTWIELSEVEGGGDGEGGPAAPSGSARAVQAHVSAGSATLPPSRRRQPLGLPL